MCSKNVIKKRPFTVFLYDRTENSEKSPEIIAAEVTVKHFPFVRLGGIYIDDTANIDERPAFTKMMSDCDMIPVDCIAVPSESRLFGSVELMCTAMKAIADRGIALLDLETERFIDYERIWDRLVMLADVVIDVEEGS